MLSAHRRTVGRHQQTVEFSGVFQLSKESLRELVVCVRRDRSERHRPCCEERDCFDLGVRKSVKESGNFVVGRSYAVSDVLAGSERVVFELFQSRRLADEGVGLVKQGDDPDAHKFGDLVEGGAGNDVV